MECQSARSRFNAGQDSPASEYVQHIKNTGKKIQDAFIIKPDTS